MKISCEIQSNLNSSKCKGLQEFLRIIGSSNFIIGSFRICSDYFLFNIVEVIGTSAEALKIMSCFKIELIIILRLTGQRMEPENKKKT